jgi:tetratricopeptide (TPR) repeat protein
VAEARLGTLASWQGRHEQELHHARRAVALVERAGPSRAKALVLTDLANTLMFGEDTAETIRVGRQALAIADSLRLNDQRVRALQPIGYARVIGGDPGGVGDLEQAVAIAVEHNLPHSAGAYGNLAAALVPLGELTRGFELQAAAREAAERFGLASFLSWLRSERVLEDYWRGRWQAALASAEQFIADVEAGAQTYPDILCRLGRGWIRLARGDVAGALQDAAASVDLGRSTGYVDLMPALAFHAQVLLVAGRATEADTSAGELLSVLAERGTLPTAPDWSGPLAFVLHTRGRGVDLADLLARTANPDAMAAGRGGHLRRPLRARRRHLRQDRLAARRGVRSPPGRQAPDGRRPAHRRRDAASPSRRLLPARAGGCLPPRGRDVAGCVRLVGLTPAAPG